MRALAAGLALALMLTGCAGRQPVSPATTRETPTSAGPSALRVWIAVFESAADPNDLESAAEKLMEAAGSAVVVAPEGCFAGLRGKAEVRPGDYVLAVTTDSKEGLEAAVVRAGREPVVTAPVEDLCPL
jgi:hypothetical protein